jgi:hypothetical protein
VTLVSDSPSILADYCVDFVAHSHGALSEILSGEFLVLNLDFHDAIRVCRAAAAALATKL